MKKKILVFQQGEGSLKTSQTEGMLREELIATPNSWVGMVSTEPGFVSGWHHHGEYDTYIYVISGEIKMEFGKDGNETCLAKPGEVLYVPKETVHRESNPSSEKQLLFGVRVGGGEPVFNVDKPDA
jgi:uncharacterized RmlC-like cupin family protein